MNPLHPRVIYNIALIGFMGTGKSAVGRLAAELLCFDFVDTDELVEQAVGKTITEIFDQEGEPAFRKYERDAVNALLERRKAVIATGGGLPVDSSNLDSLKSHSLVICLWADPETILQRIAGQTHRPLLQTPDPTARIRELLAQRAPAYRRADVLINTGFRSSKEVAQQVCHQFNMARRKR